MSLSKNKYYPNVIIRDLTNAGKVTINLKDKDTGLAVGNASVYVKCADGTTQKTTSNADGSFELAGQEGMYEVCFYKQDYLPVSVKQELKAFEYLK